MKHVIKKLNLVLLAYVNFRVIKQNNCIGNYLSSSCLNSLNEHMAFLYTNNEHRYIFCRSQWPRSLRYELSSPARTLGSWVRIPLKAWLFVCVYSVFYISRGLATGWSLFQGALPTVLGLRNWSETNYFTDALCSKVGITGEREIGI
jgi:hypothetical protein